MTDRERIRHCIELLAESLCARAKLTLDRYGPFASPHEAIDIAVAALRFAAQVEVVGASGPARIPTEEEP